MSSGAGVPGQPRLFARRRLRPGERSRDARLGNVHHIFPAVLHAPARQLTHSNPSLSSHTDDGGLRCGKFARGGPPRDPGLRTHDVLHPQDADNDEAHRCTAPRYDGLLGIGRVTACHGSEFRSANTVRIHTYNAILANRTKHRNTDTTGFSHVIQCDKIWHFGWSRQLVL